MNQKVSIVVPTFNSSATLERCLKSINEQTIACETIVVDNFSTDNTLEIARKYADHVFSQGPERSAQRNYGLQQATSSVIGFIDSDMRLEPDVAAEAYSRIMEGDSGVVVPEYTVGTTYWAHVRAFEREMYLGVSAVEAARFFPRTLVVDLGGYNEQLTGGEDWDLDLRVRKHGTIGRTLARIEHDEGEVRLLAAWRKKAYYADGYLAFGSTHGFSSLLKVVRQWPYLRSPKVLLNRFGPGLIVLKVGEGVAIALHVIRGRLAKVNRFRRR
ncbi:MAG: glycosyltransferase [Actinomycetota bacterium]|nr:glycosyltransferase [Actinomycetota bacterium]